ncbi:3-isopropylmalate dehydratase small subunit [Cupriavidus necator N-1]|uniref:3-isopropylmalate dehydratase n=1 Tax=Cupriavidus necator (strain ATCC 43291 / DSM 13513 / CCUG 52238 / LMG 8453 / N-1) TaxID=1042878 RepID=G0EUA6_CUPNN|nr:3-isopropylmalate dehydratase small subunit [Cupriavidus necator]AEI76913.1 3-isopropylmalate dehydratase small subunit [Cupriavidus necator N-1]MDX6014524.1 3-isopropylmalate dehydratase small subunit [Cupriavidus necator]
MNEAGASAVVGAYASAICLDTDAIIPSREMKRVSKHGLAEGLFSGWRYLAGTDRSLDPLFVLNQPAYTGASILLAGSDFGCGSSREHAVWTLKEFGIRAIVAPGFGAIFHNNCVRNGLLPVVLPMATVQALADDCAGAPATHHGTAIFNNVEASFKYQVTPALLMSVWPRTMPGAAASTTLQAHRMAIYQKASGIDCTGQRAVAAINGVCPSADDSQAVLPVGLRHKF